jgi:hypothetical protein
MLYYIRFSSTHLATGLQYEYDVILDERLTRKDEQVEEIETRLRELLEKHNVMLKSLSADPVISKQSFVSQVAEQVTALPSSVEALPEGVGFIKIVSVDVSQALVHSALKGFAKKYPRVSDWLEKCTEGISCDVPTLSNANDGVIPGESFVDDTHITMVHCSQMPQSTMRDQFEPLVGCAVDVTITGILWNDEIAALGVEVASDTKDKPDLPVPAPKNAFPHITLWHQPDVGPSHSNELPALVETGKATRIDFDEPVVIQGVISLWGEDRGG